MSVYLVTERLLLREFTSNDADLLFELDNDPDVMHFINGGAPVDRIEIVEEVLPAFLSYYEQGLGLGFWAAIERDSDRFLGWFHLRPRRGGDPREPELGYRLHKSAWGRGFASEGALALVDHGFQALALDRISAETMAVHVASIRVMEKAGLSFVRKFHADWPVRIPGDEYGDVEYAIEREQWESRQIEKPSQPS